MATTFDSLIDDYVTKFDKKDSSDKVQAQKLRRPLKMPKNYDFSVRNVDWNEYKSDFVLRTDAVWEKSKMLDLFYTFYKSKF
jgi:hypothetical protein